MLFAGQPYVNDLQELQQYVTQNTKMLILTPLICTQVLALFAGQPYDTDLQELQNVDAHLTNTCRHTGGDIGEEESVRLLSELPEVYI